ncbi:MAG: DUF192 domain-containing protein [Zymomonas mobilis]|uniref:DUF192 domain-containing protein n=1 Tax=Zymomonas mobilis subsp. mobilis (strain ATCC 10988 / DSM 424 / LMG 404 / NCIMB 8938 / NRRL B-806 / ZM1) TaxID=555217 RepID=A0A0H3G577_ZYMMA|nr:DUF192 domain-containing protein [Zymomonas mobilis]ACV74958.1 protein of unknown function DUF192 [Zymomonas mobilis subsp. mobilis NCIMB 11163]AEH62260.1 protein of unknown function DUF192 [Zymomonas mobilis subsp. mobilis ATCC 10988]MCP9307522.1 DUF192 domain-containing protein [Zymomonas mobilis]TQL28146.1 hypothetical protein FBY55_1489 [Zymomonas mobilis]TQL30081.1 hypothetical protein FBY54_0921 [Zymomonas mobilis]
MRKILMLAAVFILSANNDTPDYKETPTSTEAVPPTNDPWANCEFEIKTASFGTKIPFTTVPVAHTKEQINQGVANLYNGTPIMLFLWDQPRRYAFTMRSVLRPMSVAFINDKGEITQIENMKPNTTELHVSDKPVRVALEVGKGLLSSHNITTGSRITIKQCSSTLPFPEKFFQEKK